MASSADAIIQNLLAGTGYGRTPGDFRQQAQEIQGNDQALQINRMKMGALVQAQQQEEQYSQDVAAWVANGSPPSDLPTLAIKYPKKYQAIKAGWDLKDGAQQRADLNFFGQAYAAANNGRTDLAKQQLVARRDAEKNAGGDTSELDDLIGQFDVDPQAAVSTLKSVSLAHMYAGDKDGFAKAFGLGAEKYASAGEGLIFNTSTGEFKGERQGKLEKVEVTQPDGSVVTQWRRIAGGGGGRPAAVGDVAPGWENFHTTWLDKTEGGYADRDGASGAPVNFGVNQKANPDVKVKDLTKDQAKKILHDRYWVASGADKLPPALAAIHGDTAVNMGVETAKRLLNEARGDPEKYLQLRDARYRSIGGKDLKTWLNRNNALRAYVGLQDGAPPAADDSEIVESIVTKPPGSAGKREPPSGFQWKPDGSLAFIPGGPADPKVKKDTKPLTEIQAKSSGYLRAAVAAASVLNTLGNYNPSEVSRALDTGGESSFFRRGLGQKDRRALNAQRAFANAILRLETGATISAAEVNQKAKTLFPIPGDGAEVLADKTAQREAALQALQIAAGPGAVGVSVKTKDKGKSASAPAGFRILRVRPK